MSPAIEKKTSPVKETEMAAEVPEDDNEKKEEVTKKKADFLFLANSIDEEQEIRDNAGCACKLLKEKETMVMVVEVAKKKKNGSGEWY
ncbi:hypothetical protein AHAS_Ahas19G0076900 [Arachis hypogaea]